MSDFYDSWMIKTVEKLSDEDKSLLIEVLFRAMVNVTTVYYAAAGFTQKEIDVYLAIEVNSIKSLIKERVKMNEVNSTPVILEGNPNEPTDKSFEFDAKFDFERLIQNISKSN